MTEKNHSNLWLYISIFLVIIVLILLWIILFERKNNNDDFEKKTYCHSLYDEVYDSIDEQINNHDNTISRFMSNFDFFYSKETDSCIVSYVRNSSYYENDRRITSDTYIIKDYFNDKNIFYCIQSNEDFDEYQKKNCYSDMLEELKKLK